VRYREVDGADVIRRVLRSFQRHEEPPTGSNCMIVGLGNIGAKYEGTRHNLGFEVVGELARRFGTGNPRNRFDARIEEAIIGGTKVILAAPTTMMNNSGFAVSQLARWYKLPAEDILIVYDELDLPFGKIRLRPSGGPGGHNGVRSVIDQLGTTDFPRVRIGVGRPTSGSTIGFLLTRFSVEERPYVPEIVSLAADASECWVRSDIEASMNEFNTRSVDVASSRATT
jgi:PTH1 family peptidyl-tRNA hydrolase